MYDYPKRSIRWIYIIRGRRFHHDHLLVREPEDTAAVQSRKMEATDQMGSRTQPWSEMKDQGAIWRLIAVSLHRKAEETEV